MKTLIPRTGLNIAMVVLGITVAALLSSHSVPPPDAGPRVTVVNTPNNPVPIIQQGPVNVKAVDSSTAQPVSVQVVASSTTGIGPSARVYTVPAGKRLVVQYLSSFVDVVPPGR